MSDAPNPACKDSLHSDASVDPHIVQRVATFSESTFAQCVERAVEYAARHGLQERTSQGWESAFGWSLTVMYAPRIEVVSTAPALIAQSPNQKPGAEGDGQ